MPSSTSSDDADAEIVPERSRQVVRLVLEAALDPQQASDRSGRFAYDLMTLGNSLAPALAEVLEDPNLRIRMLAAWMLLKWAETNAAAGRQRKSLERAELVFLEALQQDGLGPRLLACIQLSNGAVPPKAAPLLASLVTHEDRTLAVYAAAALTWCGEAAAQAIPVLTGVLHQDEELLATVAADGLTRLGIRSEEAIVELVRRLQTAPSSIQYSLVLALRKVGPPAAIAIEPLSAIARDNAANAIIRGAAAEALASIAPADQTIRRLLQDLLKDADWRVIDGALNGAAKAGGVPERALKRFNELLLSASADDRRVAARGFRLLGQKAEPAVQPLVDALCREENRETLLELATACVALGAVAAKSLCAVIQRGILQQIGSAATALTLLGPVAAKEIAENLLNHDDEVVRRTGVSLLRGSGKGVEPAVAALAGLLPSLNDERAADVLSLFAECGTRSPDAIAAVISCRLERQGAIATQAARTLQALGDIAIVAVQSRLSGTDGDVRQRLEDLLARLHPETPHAFDRLLKLNADEHLLLFLFAGGVIETAGHIGLRKVSKQLEKIKAVDALGLPTSEASLRDMLSALEQRLGSAPTLKTTKGNCLTDAGRSLLREARDYLRWRGYKV